jgi:alkanesulfonate monooxygenase SsuD/methylene tetrahydromethanopterin reductase-like flavin-dependent oxidoreductase (luciferase family)
MARLGIAFSGGPNPSEIVECVKLAEALGYESAWVAEGHGGDQFAVLAACAVQTSRIGLGTAITSVFVRTIPTIAMAAATLDHLSEGRFILGVEVEPQGAGRRRAPGALSGRDRAHRRLRPVVHAATPGDPDPMCRRCSRK